MATITTDLICNLNQPVAATFLHGNLFSQDNAGNTINVYVMDNGEPATIGGTVSANVIRADGNTVAVSGSLSGNQCSVVLPQACYAVPGRVEIIIKLTQSTTITTIAAIVANVYRSTTDTVVDPGTIIPSIQTLIAEIEEAVDSIPVDYSGLLATIAADYSSSRTYQVGQYAWQGGVLKRCIVPITTAETYTAAHWTNAVIGDDISAIKNVYALKSALNYETLHGIIIDAFINFAEGVIVRNDNNSKTIYIPCLPNTKYTVKKTAGTRFVLATSSETPAFEGSIMNYVYDYTADSLTIVTPPNAKYMLAWVWHSTDSGTAEEMLASVLIYRQEHNRNLWDGDTVINAYIDVNSSVIASNSNARTVYIPCEPNTKYKISKTAGQRFSVASCIATPANNVGILSSAFDMTGNEIEYTTTANAKYLCAFVYLSTADTGISAADMLASVSIVEEGKTDNLWNGSNTLDAYINSVEKAIVRNDNLSKLVYVQCKPNTVYTVRKTAGTRFVIGCSAGVPALGGSLISTNDGYDYTADNISILTPPTAAYLCAWVWHSTDTGISADRMLASVSIEENDVDILFWGDSLTAGAGGNGTSYPSVCAKALGRSFLNCGVGGETANTIAARQGGNYAVIPAGNVNGTYSLGEIVDIFGHEIAPLRQGTGSGTGSTLMINGDICTLTISQTSGVSDDAEYTIAGYTKGASAVPVYGKFIGCDLDSDVTVIFVGQNGSWIEDTNNLENRIAIIDSMIAHVRNEKYVVVGLTSGTSQRATEEAQLRKLYGAKYIPMRKMLVDYGLTIAGITPTSQDSTDIANGTVPTSLRSDEIHMNAYGYTAIGKIVASVITALGY